MTTAQLIDEMAATISRMAEIIREQRAMLILHGVDDIPIDEEYLDQAQCLVCPLNAEK